MHDFAFHRATSVADAAKAIGAASDGKFIAGGQTLLPTLRQRLAEPSDMVDLSAIAELKASRSRATASPSAQAPRIARSPIPPT